MSVDTRPKGWYTYDVQLEGSVCGGGEGKNEMLSDVGGWVLASALDVQSLFFY